MSPLRARLAKHEIRAELEAQGLDGQWLADTLEGETRLARSVHELINITKELEARGIHLECVRDKVDTSTAAGRFFFNIMAAVAELEHDMIVERTKAGLEASRARGQRLGKKPWGQRDAAVDLLLSGHRVRAVARQLGCGESTIRKHCRDYLPARLKAAGLLQ